MEALLGLLALPLLWRKWEAPGGSPSICHLQSSMGLERTRMRGRSRGVCSDREDGATKEQKGQGHGQQGVYTVEGHRGIFTEVFKEKWRG